MSQSDFLRQLPSGAGPMYSQRTLSQRLRRVAAVWPGRLRAR